MQVATAVINPIVNVGRQAAFWNEGSARIARNEMNTRKAPRSLIISPDLDALLEFDENARRVWPTSPVRQTPRPPVWTPPAGLPPPPRNSLKNPLLPLLSPPPLPPPPAKAGPLVTVHEQVTVISEPVLPTPNPYINPAPSLDAVLRRSEVDRGSRESSLPETVKGEGTIQGDQSDDPQHPSSLSQSTTTKSCVDKLLSIRRSPFGLFSELKIERNESGKFHLPPVSNLRNRVRRLTKSQDVSSDMYEWQTVLNTRGRTEADTPTLSVSHDNPRSSVDTSSSSAFASTTDPHISISSTIYLSSSIHSLSPDPYYASDALSSHLSELPLTDADNQEPFIHFDSPAAPQPTVPETHNQSTVPSQPPPIPTTPKPIFSRPPAKISPTQHYQEPNEFANKLPPTTDFLDLDGRSGLIRKNQKLAQVFGQSPGPSHQADNLIVQPESRLVRQSISMSSNPEITAVYGSKPVSEHSFPTADMKRQLSADAYDPTSFIDLSDNPNLAISATPKKIGEARLWSPSQQSLFGNMPLDEQAEELRRRKREKLAKMHRFLGSRVPAGLVLGVGDPGTQPDVIAESQERVKKPLLRPRRCSSVEPASSTWSDEVDRIKEDLNIREKAIIVRRAQKMEKVFGVAPPQTLYHNHCSPSPIAANAGTAANNKWITSWTPGGNHPTVAGHRNANRSSYIKTKKKKGDRPSTSESNRRLLPKGRSEPEDYGFARNRPSVVYSHYEESLKSLDDIIDRDDKESLAELHEYLNSGDMTVPPPLQSFTRTGRPSDRRLSTTSSIKSERRRSLPARTSMTSLFSEYSITLPTPEVTDFQARRRKAAKLTQFFGVDYRELISDVLESIERGLEHERRHGTLNQDQVQDLLGRLRKLRTKREGFF